MRINMEDHKILLPQRKQVDNQLRDIIVQLHLVLSALSKKRVKVSSNKLQLSLQVKQAI